MYQGGQKVGGADQSVFNRVVRNGWKVVEGVKMRSIRCIMLRRVEENERAEEDRHRNN